MASKKISVMAKDAAIKRGMTITCDRMVRGFYTVTVKRGNTTEYIQSSDSKTLALAQALRWLRARPLPTVDNR